MSNVWKIANYCTLGILIGICMLGLFYKHISFGHGLGDLVGYFFLFAGTIIHFVSTLFLFKKQKYKQVVLFLLFFLFTIYITLWATLFRGSEYPWNGKLFYESSPTTVIK